MCWSLGISGLSFLIILGFSVLFFRRNLENDRLLGIFILTYGTIQLFEFIIWGGIDYNIQYLNILGSVLAAILLHFHPLGMVLGIKYDKLYKNETNSGLFKAAFLVASIFFCFGIISTLYNVFYNKKWTFVAFQDKVSKHLIWDFPNNYPYGIILTILSLIIIFKKNYVFGIVLLIYFFFPLIYIYKFSKSEEKNIGKMLLGSYWCWVCAAFSFILYFANPYFQRSNLGIKNND